jgi:hypothetical protein
MTGRVIGLRGSFEETTEKGRKEEELQIIGSLEKASNLKILLAKSCFFQNFIHTLVQFLKIIH